MVLLFANPTPLVGFKYLADIAASRLPSGRVLEFPVTGSNGVTKVVQDLEILGSLSAGIVGRFSETLPGLTQNEGPGGWKAGRVW